MHDIRQKIKVKKVLLGKVEHYYVKAQVGLFIIENNDLEEMLSMAELAERDFAAERTQVVVVSVGAVEGRDAERAEAERAEAESRHRHRLVIPRRPGWSRSSPP